MRNLPITLVIAITIAFCTLPSMVFSTDRFHVTLDECNTQKIVVHDEVATTKVDVTTFVLSHSTGNEIVSQNNLSVLYIVCVALVLFNLVVQIKIVLQMVGLFLQLRKNEEYPLLNY